MAIYNSSYTGAEVDASVAKTQAITKTPQQINDLNQVVANPTLAGTEADLTGLQVGNTKYTVPQGTPVVANPTLAGTEADLTGLQVGTTKYKVPGGTALYSNTIVMNYKTNSTASSAAYMYISIVSSTIIDSLQKLLNYLNVYGTSIISISNGKFIPATGNHGGANCTFAVGYLSTAPNTVYIMTKSIEAQELATIKSIDTSWVTDFASTNVLI